MCQKSVYNIGVEGDLGVLVRSREVEKWNLGRENYMTYIWVMAWKTVCWGI